MAKFGYGYSESEIIQISSHFINTLNKRPVNAPVTRGRYRHFLKRNPAIQAKEAKPIDIYWAKSATTKNITIYFENLDTCLQRYGLKDKPEYIYNVDEKNFLPQSKKKKLVAARKRKILYSVQPPRGKTTTVIGCGNAAGDRVPPYFVFCKGKARIFLQNLTEGTGGVSSSNGWSNTAIQ